jgi:hypothetical protein
MDQKMPAVHGTFVPYHPVTVTSSYKTFRIETSNDKIAVSVCLLDLVTKMYSFPANLNFHSGALAFEYRNVYTYHCTFFFL